MILTQRKKKTKVPYVESELSVQEAVDRVCTMDHLFDKYNVTSVSGKAEYTRMETSVGNKEYKNQLLAMCQVTDCIQKLTLNVTIVSRV